MPPLLSPNTSVSLEEKKSMCQYIPLRAARPTLGLFRSPLQPTSEILVAKAALVGMPISGPTLLALCLILGSGLSSP